MFSCVKSQTIFSMALLPFFLLCFLLVGIFQGGSSVLDASSGMEAGELVGLFEVMGAFLGDPNWTQMHPHPCTDTPWPGIQCEVSQQEDPVFHVTKLHVGPDVSSQGCKASAHLSVSLLKLPYLKTLSIFSCFLANPITLSPPLFASFSSLEHLIIKSNPSLYGEIPPTLSKVPTLRVLSLSQNSLIGEIPQEIGGLGNLEQLDLSYNHLGGEIPKEIGGLKSLTILDLCCNGLKGKLPSTVGQLLSLQKIDLSSNKLDGRVPPEVGELQKLVLLDLSHNLLTGPIPETLSGLKELEYFLIENNPINTGIPFFVGSLGNLKMLSFSGCGLTGSIPITFSSLSYLIALSLDRNRLSGVVPPSLGSLPHLSQLNLSQNQLSGELSFTQDFVDRLGKRLDIRGNTGLCTRQHFHFNFSLHPNAPACLNSNKSNNRSYDQDQGTDYKRLKPSWYDDGRKSSSVSFVRQKQLNSWFLGCNFLVILVNSPLFFT